MKKGNKMKLKRQSLLFKRMLLLAVLVITFGCATDSTQTVVNFTELSFSDEFDTDGPPDPAKWAYNIGTGEDGWGNQELQYYTDRPENVTVSNGYLIITARQDDFQGSSYTSARLVTKGLFEQKYGRFEARMRLPYGKGYWPAFWMLGTDFEREADWPACGEIDIMENAGAFPTATSSAIHGPGYNGGTAIFKVFDFENERVDTDFHVYGIEWGPEYINFYVDDVLYNQLTPEKVTGEDALFSDVSPVENREWVFDNDPFFMLLNVAIGGTFDGPPNEETVFPQSMLVDYVRVYKYNGLD